MKNVKKIFAVLLAVLLCGACLVPAFAEGEPDPETCEHEWLYNVIITPATCVPGVQGDRCTLCNATQNETEIPAVQEHDLIMVIDTAPTCGAAGVGHQYCTVCKGVFNEGTVIQPTGAHTFEWVVDVPASCGKAGYKHEECKVCHAVQSEYTPLPKTSAHKWAWKVTTEPTCGTQGEKREYCTVCRENGIDTFRDTALVAATGAHNWVAVDDARNKAPTCVYEGVQVYKCTNPDCKRGDPDLSHNAEKADAIPKAAHTDANGDDKCDVCGTYVGSGTGVSAKSVYNRMVDFFWGLWQRIVNLFTGKYF